MGVSPKFRAAQERVNAAIQAMAEILGPRKCIHGEWESEDCDCEWSDTEALSDELALNGMVLVTNWTNLEDGESYYGLITQPDQLRTSTVGMLFMALEREKDL